MKVLVFTSGAICNDSEKENLETTYVEGVQRISSPQISIEKVQTNLMKLIDAVKIRDTSDLDELVNSLVPEFKSATTLDGNNENVKTAQIIPLTETKSRK